MPIKLASAMSRLGTETAFEVLARARALEAKGMEVVHLEIDQVFHLQRLLKCSGIKPRG